METRKAIARTNDTRYFVVDCGNARRWLMQGDEVVIRDIEVVGWNTRVYIHVTGVEPNPYVPPSQRHLFAKEGDCGFIDIRNRLPYEPDNDQIDEMFK